MSDDHNAPVTEPDPVIDATPRRRRRRSAPSVGLMRSPMPDWLPEEKWYDFERGEVMTLLGLVIDRFPTVDADALQAAEKHQARLLKPPGSLGRLELLGVRLAGLSGECPPPYPDRVAVCVFAGDHGVQAHGVSPWPAEVTGQMVTSILAGGAAVNVLAREVGADVSVYDMGMLTGQPEREGLWNHRVGAGTADMTRGPAMTRIEFLRALRVGLNASAEHPALGAGLVIPGEVGIGNTTAAAALISALTGADPDLVTGPGAGAEGERLALKKRLVAEAMWVNRLDVEDVRGDPFAVGGAVGGFEHVAMAGFILGAAMMRVPVLLDGVSVCAAALLAHAIEPRVVDWLIAGHAGVEPGVRVALEYLGLEPVLDLGLRLGEGSGALAAVPTLRAAAAIMRDMATFESAGVTGTS